MTWHGMAWQERGFVERLWESYKLFQITQFINNGMAWHGMAWHGTALTEIGIDRSVVGVGWSRVGGVVWWGVCVSVAVSVHTR